MKPITFKEIREAARNGYNATVIINGEFYAVDPSENDFIEGVQFAADLIEDNRSRRNSCFLWIDGRKKNLTKKAVQINEAKNDEVKSLANWLRRISATNEDIIPWLDGRKNFWRLPS